MTWTVDEEICLFMGIMMYKPAGRDKNFQMCCLAYKLQHENKLPYSISDIWKRLNELYNIDLISENETVPYSEKQSEFSLPGYFNSLKSQEFPRSDNNVPASLKTKVKTEPVHKISDDNPPTPATNSSSTSPSSVSATPSASKRTRKSVRGTTAEQDKSMPPPATTSVSNKSTPSASRKSTRHKN